MNRFCFAMILVLATEPLSTLAQVVHPTEAIDQVNRTANQINRIAKELTLGCEVSVNPKDGVDKPTVILGLGIAIQLRNENSLSSELEKIFDELNGFSFPIFLQLINFETQRHLLPVARTLAN